MGSQFRHSIVLILLIVSSPALQAQEKIKHDERAENLFQSALQMFEDSDWLRAATIFQELAQQAEVHQRSSASYIMAARSQLLSGTATRALRLLEEFRRRFPGSSYTAESWLISGDASAAASSPGRALECYLRSWKEARADTLTLGDRLGAVDVSSLSPYDLRVARNLLHDHPSRHHLEELLGLQESTQPAPPKQQHADGSDPSLRLESSRPAIVAVALPLSMGDARKQRMVDHLRIGMEKALQQHNAVEDAFPVEMQMFDASSRPGLEDAVVHIEQNPRIGVLLGGVFSEDARLVCDVMAERDVLVLLPTATEAALSTYGRNIYQCNASMEHRARLLADFAMLELNADEALVLAPATSWPRAMAESFIARWNERGMKVHPPVYYNGAGDIEEACTLLGKLDGAKNRILFAPLQSRTDIAVVLESVRRHGCASTVLGAGNWNHPEELTTHGQGLRILFESDVAPDRSSPELHRLERSCREAGLTRVSPEILFGYDAMNIALRLVGRGPVTRRELRQNISDVFEGLRAPVSFRDGRVNAALNILQFINGRVIALDSFHAK